jgi:hypothetical protein
MNSESAEAYVERIIELAGDKRKRKAESANQGQVESPRPLMREMPPAEPFPVDALGEVLADAARAIHDRVQAPLAIGAQSVLGAATLVTQGHADIELPIGGKRIKPISSYFITIAGSGERKTECDYQANWAIRKYEGKLRENHDAAVFSYTNDKLAWDKARGEAVSQASRASPDTAA